MKDAVFWHVTPCVLLSGFRRNVGTCSWDCTSQFNRYFQILPDGFS